MNNVVRTPLEKLNLTDRFLFAETMDEPEAYEAVVGILLGNEIELLGHTQTEKELRVSPELRAVRLMWSIWTRPGRFILQRCKREIPKTWRKGAGIIRHSWMCPCWSQDAKTLTS